MNAGERRRRIEDLCHAALERNPAARAAFLATACGSDEALRRDVEALLAHAQTAEGFLSTPLEALAARALTDERGASLLGQSLGAYQIRSRLGSGGMGDVYRARDTALGRDVAIKVLPAAFVTDGQRLARFEREARILAALNHPHIGAIYGLEPVDSGRALVLELVEGETLADRIARGALAVHEALPIARQIAEALDAAHDKGIVHRDLKPANIKITHAGVVKVLDFGLAKLATADGSSADLTQSPTVTVGGTRDGMILGTPAYMSPEQARGRAVDKRSDIWAFGCVLYEMLAGRRAFAGETLPDTIAAILEREPAWDALPATIPTDVDRLLRRCLEKDPARRLHDAGDVRIEIDDALVVRVGEPASKRCAASRPITQWALLATVATAAFLAALVPAALSFRRGSVDAPEMRLEVTTPPTDDPASMAISPDGRRLAFVATSEGRTRLWIRALESTTAHPLVGTDGARFPFWSPDSRSIGFFADDRLKRIDVAGGSAQTLASAPNGTGGSWNRDGVIILSGSAATPISRISASGGDAVAVTPLDPPRQQSHRSPRFLPDGHHFLYFVQGTQSGVYLSALDAPKSRRLIEADANAVYRRPATSCSCARRRSSRSGSIPAGWRWPANRWRWPSG